MNADDPRFSGIGRLYGRTALEKFNRSRVCIVGIGGVGTWVAEALARSGIGSLILVDLDDICVTNTNRQIHALEGSHGRSKVDVMAERLLAISPECEVIPHHGFYTEASSGTIFGYKPDLVIDAIDVPGPKCHLIASCYAMGMPVIACGGAGGRRNAAAIVQDDLSKTYGDPLLALIRKQLRTKYGMPFGEKPKKVNIPCVFSPERPVFPTCEGSISHQRDPESGNTRMGCEAGFGSATHITGTFGFFMAGLALDLLSSQTQ